MTRIYVGNLNLSTTAEHLQLLFERCGTVRKAGLVRDEQTGKPRGFGFVLMSDDIEAKAAILKLNWMRVDGSIIFVKDALPPAAQFRA